MVVAFEAYGRPLDMVTAFKYCGRILTASYDYWQEVVTNFQKAWKRWAWLSRIIGREGADPQTYTTFYKAVVQANLLFGAEVWIMFPRIGKTQGGFLRRVDCRLEGMCPRWDTADRWVYPLL